MTSRDGAWDARDGTARRSTADPGAGRGTLVHVVLSVHDGGDHLDALLESLAAQSHAAWRLIARDDGSTDDSLRRLEAFARSDGRVEILPTSGTRIGTRASYSALLEASLERGADWVALCDQDDVWLPDKLARHRERLESVSADPADPWLAHSDLVVVGPRLDRRHGSLMRYMGIRHQDSGALGTLLVQNFVTGCASVSSRGLLAIALPIPEAAVMHDWWLALVAAAVGRIAFDPACPILYRQHAANQIGARGYARSLWSLARRSLALRRHEAGELIATIRQAEALRARLREGRVADAGVPGLRDADRLVSEYVDSWRPGVGRLDRLRTLRRLGVGRQDVVRDLALRLKLLSTRLDVPPSRDAAADEGRARSRAVPPLGRDCAARAGTVVDGAER
jgi:glycosyltransferase involved in cell wall biosynthesis